jgi:neutral ceramidase
MFLSNAIGYQLTDIQLTETQRPRLKVTTLIMKMTRFLAAFLVVCGVLDLSNEACAATGTLLAGTAKISITPVTDEPLHDPVYARSLVLEVNGERLAFVAVDLAVFTSDNVEKTCKEKYGVAKVLLCASHNHTAPSKPGKGPEFSNLKAFYEKQVIQAVGMAVTNMFQARISAGRRSFPQLGFKRLIVREDGHARESWMGDDHYAPINPDRIPFGPVDQEVGVIRIDDTNNQARAIIMNYACHADVVCFSYAISADFPGVAARKVEESFGNGVNCLFVNGAAGNVAPLFTVPRKTSPTDPFKTDYTPMERMGELLAYETVKVAKSLTGKPGDTTVKYQDAALGFTGRFNKDKHFDVRITTIMINDDIVIAANPGELFAELGLEWKAKMQAEVANPFYFGYTWMDGQWPGYVPSIKGAALGGFGADQDAGMIEVGAGEAIFNKHLENYFILTGLMRDKPGPSGFRRGPRWYVVPVPEDIENKEKG